MMIPSVVAPEEASLDEIRQWVVSAAAAASAKGGLDVVALEVGEVLAITDAFVIASGTNRRQVLAMADEVEARVKAEGGPPPMRIEGLTEAQWVLLDYGDFVVHLFLDDVRRYYDLERLWADAPPIALGLQEARAANGD
ncbi:MAG: ribosome silencing factor RsfS/YbeB/iojap [Acidimicrobiales bacterium]|jgi:ribosome-associated protein|nr:ribosome silencing factor RsfS/YbeB/iojap [Acidimicrobiales bacterium]